jgi:hypothetical protein
MSPSKATIGDVLGRVYRDAFSVAKQEVEVVMPDYRDAHFDSGFGIRTTGEMTREQVRWLLRLNRAEPAGARTLHELLDKFGAVQIRCPEIRSTNVGPRFCPFRRDPLAFPIHKDSYAGGEAFAADDLILAVLAHAPILGSTMVIPDAEFLRLLRERGSIINVDPEKRIEESGVAMSVDEAVARGIDVYQKEYWHWWKAALKEMANSFYLAPEEDRTTFTETLETHPQTIAHDFDALEVLGHSDRLTVHGPGKGSSGVFAMRIMHH